MCADEVNFQNMEPVKDPDEAKNRVGKSLQYEREKRGLSPEEVARELRLPASVIYSLEAGDVDSLPEPVYVRGYVRAYCRLLKISPQPLLENFVFEPSGSEESDSLPETEEHVHHLTRLWGSIAVLSVVALLVLFWRMEQPREFDHSPPVSEPDALSVPEPFTGRPVGTDSSVEFDSDAVPGVGRAGQPPPDNLVAVTIRSSTRSWAYLTDGSGEVLINRMVLPDYHGTVYGTFPFHFKIGDARGVRVWIDGVEYDLQRHVSQLNTAFFKMEAPPR